MPSNTTEVHSTFGIGVENNVTGPADLLSGNVASSGGFQASGIGSIGTLGGGQTYSDLSFTLPSVNDGVVKQTITLTPTDSNASGFSTILPTETLTLIGTVADLPLPTIAVAYDAHQLPVATDPRGTADDQRSKHDHPASNRDNRRCGRDVGGDRGGHGGTEPKLRTRSFWSAILPISMRHWPA